MRSLPKMKLYSPNIAKTSVSFRIWNRSDCCLQITSWKMNVSDWLITETVQNIVCLLRILFILYPIPSCPPQKKFIHTSPGGLTFPPCTVKSVAAAANSRAWLVNGKQQWLSPLPTLPSHWVGCQLIVGSLLCYLKCGQQKELRRHHLADLLQIC